MSLSLIEMFGNEALSVAKGQQGRNDVGADSGICWQEIFEALSEDLNLESDGKKGVPEFLHAIETGRS